MKEGLRTIRPLVIGVLLLWTSACSVLESIGGGGFEEEPCQPGELCVTVTADETTGKELRLMLYEAIDEDWPVRYRSLPTPSWVIREYPAVPERFPLRIRIALKDNLFAISSNELENSRLGLAIATGVDSIMVVEPTDARGFSEATLVYQEGMAMDFGVVELALPKGDTCDLNEFHPSCLTGALFWENHLLGEEGFVPGAVYLDVADIDGDGIEDIVTVGEPHFEEPDLPLTALRLGVYYLSRDLTVRETEIVDAWSESNQDFYSPWGVKVIQHGGAPMILVGTNIPGLAPLEEGAGTVFSYQQVDGKWVRAEVRSNPDPTNINYNAMIVVTCDIDQDGDEDLALSGAFKSSSIGSWMENTGETDPAWISHLLPMDPETDPYIRGTLAYKCNDLNHDGYPEVIYNGMFDIANTDPPRYRGEIWLGINPGPGGWDAPWEMVVIDDDNWASADMWFHDFNGDGNEDLIANQIFSSTVTRYVHPGDNLQNTWESEIIISGLTSPSDMWLEDIDGDGLVDVVSADNTAHRGVWHKNPGHGSTQEWLPSTIFRSVRMPGDFALVDLDRDGDSDWVGTSMTWGQAFVVERVEPESGLVTTIQLPDDFREQISKLVLILTKEVPLKGIPRAILATINNADADGDGELDVEQLIGPDNQIVLSFSDVEQSGDYHVMAVLYVEGGGNFQPDSGVDYVGYSEQITLGDGTVRTSAQLELAP